VALVTIQKYEVMYWYIIII